MHAPLTFEALAIAFFTAVALATPTASAPRGRRARAAVLSAAVVVGAVVASQTAAPDLRGWLGHAYLAAGYWIPALLIPSRADVGGAFEAWLFRIDARWRQFAITPPVLAVPVLELSYLLCYILVPAAFVLVWANGSMGDVDHFWTAVLLSGFLCYGSLPWLISRPPRLLDAASAMKARPASTAVRSLNEFVLARVSHGLNTFPSGHVAVSLAAALEVSRIWQPAGIVLVLIAAAIAAGAVFGRYHYTLDVLLGAIVGVAASSLV